MKIKFLSVLYALLLFAAAGAEEIELSNATQTYTGRTTIMLTIGETYTVSIPPSLPISYGSAETELVIGVTELDLTDGYVLRIGTKKPNGELTRTDGEEGAIPYALLDGDAAFSERTFTETGTIPLTVSVAPEDWYAAPPGEYAGSVTFSVSVVHIAGEGGE